MLLWKRIFTAERSRQQTGLSIAFLDTGISPLADFMHPENRIVAFRDLVNGRTDPYDDNGHGTHVTVPFPTNKNPLPYRKGVFPEFNMSCI